MYVFSLGVGLQAILVASLGDAADHLSMRKLLLLSSAVIGSLSGFMFFFLDGASVTWSICALLAILSNATLGLSLVCLNSYIPSLAKSRVRVSRADARPGHLPVRRPSSPTPETDRRHHRSLVSKSMAQISAQGIAIGYGAGILALSISLIPIAAHNGSTDSLRSAIGFSAIWWAIFTIPAGLWLPPSRAFDPSTIFNPFDPVKNYRHIVSMLGRFNQLNHTIKFLMAWFLLSDAFSTLASTAILFAKTELKMSSSGLVSMGIITPTTGIIGASIAPIFQRRLKYCSGLNGSLKMLKLLVGLGCLVPGYVSFTIIFGLAGLTTQLEMYLIGAVFGFSYGAFQSYARSVYAELIPPGQEAKWYALYSITDKSSSFFGPLVIGIIGDYTHNFRFGFIFILFTLCLSFPILNRVDLPTGKQNALEFSQRSDRQAQSG